MVFRELPRCDEPGGSPAARAVVAESCAIFPDPSVGLPSGHTSGPSLTLPLGVRARVLAPGAPSLVIAKLRSREKERDKGKEVLDPDSLDWGVWNGDGDARRAAEAARA